MGISIHHGTVWLTTGLPSKAVLARRGVASRMQLQRRLITAASTLAERTFQAAVKVVV